MNTFREKPEWLEKAIKSYLTQTGVRVQVIVSCVDGDANIPLIENFHCDIVRNENPGIYQQINAAIPYITGDWVCYASSNDVAIKTKLIHEVNRCVKFNKIVCYSSFYRCDKFLHVNQTYFSRPYDYHDHLNGNFVSDCSLVRTDIFRKYTPFHTEWGNHAYFDLWLRIYEGEGNVFIHNTDPTWFYRRHEGEKLQRRRNTKLQDENREILYKMISSHKSYMSLSNVSERATCDDEMDGGCTIRDPETHFVYVYVQSPARWNELEISVNSIRRHFKGNAKFFCVGDPPGIKNVVHIPLLQVKGRGSKPRDALEKLKAIARCPLINNDFIYCYDDVILLRDITPEWFDKRIAVEHVRDFTTHWKEARGIIPDQGWRSLFIKTFSVLTKRGFTTWNAETHLPRKMDKDKIMQTIERFGEDVCSDALFNSLYFNQHNGKPDILLKENIRIKAGMHRAYDNHEKILSEIKGRTWLNYSDPALNEKFKKIINQIIKGEVKV